MQATPAAPSTPLPETAPQLPPDVVPLIPMRNLVMFPHVLTAVSVGRPKSIAALKHALDGVAKLSRLRSMSDASGEHSMPRTYLE